MEVNDDIGGGRVRQDWALAIGAGLTAFGMGLLTPVLPGYAQSLGASLSVVGLLLASFGVARLVTALPTSWLAGRFGHARLLIASPTVAAPVAALCAIAGGFWPLAVFCMVEAMTAAMYTTVGMAVIAREAEPRQRARTLARFQVAGLVGAAVGPLAGGLVAQRLGDRAAFILYAALSAFVAGWLAKTLDHHQDEQTERDRGPRVVSENRGVLRRSLVVPGLMALWLLAFALVFTRVGLQLALVPLLGAWRLGLNPQQIGLALSVSGVTSLILFYPAGWLADRYGRRVVIGLGGLGMVGALALFGGATTYLVFVLGALVLGVGSGLTGPGPAAYLADVLPVEERTVGVGIYRMVGDAGASLAPPVLGWLAEHGGYGAALFSAAALLLTTMVAFGWFGRAPKLAATTEPLQKKSDSSVNAHVAISLRPPRADNAGVVVYGGPFALTNHSTFSGIL